MPSSAEKKESSNCKEFTKCLEYLYLMLDNEATTTQKDYLMKHMESCMVCFEQYEVEKQLRELLKGNLASQPVPADLAQVIRLKVFQSA